MRGWNFGTRWHARERMHSNNIWMVFETPQGAKATSVGERCRWGAWKYKGEQQEEGRREKQREGGLLMHEPGVGGGGVESCAEEECRLFPCVGRTGEPCWLQAGAVSPNEKSCVGHEGSPRHGRPEAKHSQKSNRSVAHSWPHTWWGTAEMDQHCCRWSDLPQLRFALRKTPVSTL